MISSQALFALASLVALGTDAPNWQTDYTKARQQATSEQKSLAVFVASGQNGQQQFVRGTQAAEINKVLAQQYVCVYIDSSSDAGKKLAAAFELPDGVGLVIGDRTGASQAFYHSGTIDDTTLARSLRRYAEAGRTTVTTETVASVTAETQSSTSLRVNNLGVTMTNPVVAQAVQGYPAPVTSNYLPSMTQNYPAPVTSNYLPNLTQNLPTPFQGGFQQGGYQGGGYQQGGFYGNGGFRGGNFGGSSFGGGSFGGGSGGCPNCRR
jgi:hypothetical protein